MIIKEYFDPMTSTLTYLIHDEKTRDAVVIDPVMDFEYASGRVFSASASRIISEIKEKQLRLHYILETHAHADHMTGAQLLKKAFPQAQVAIGERIREVQAIFFPLFDEDEEQADGSQFDRLLKDGEKVQAGALTFEVIATPGHTPACVSYLFGENLFTGDAIFMPDSGTGRCDFPGGNAETLYNSIQSKIYGLPDSTRVYVGHDYQPNGRPLQFVSTVGEQKEKNIHLRASTTKDAFVEFRTNRDKGLKAPQLLLPSLQVNVRAGHLPTEGARGRRYLKIPLALDIQV